MDNKFPGKDVTIEDLKSKFPLAAKQDKYHKSKFTVANIEFGGDLIPIFAGPNTVENESILFKCCEIMEKNKLNRLLFSI